MPSINWLHLSDLHIGATGWDTRWSQQVKPEFLDRYLKEWIQKNGTLDLVFITGDLTNSATEEEFNILSDKLAEFANVFQQEGIATPKFAVVPGNHDFTPFNLQETDALTKMALNSLCDWEQDEVMQQAFFESDSPSYINIITKSFRQYIEWQDKNQNNELFLPYTQTGYIPGDFSATYEKEGFKLGIVGLNSAFLQLTNNRKDTSLVLDARQFEHTCNQSGGFQQWVENHNANILLTHHTPQNLDDTSKSILKNILRSFSKHLCGHMSEDVYYEIRFRNVWQTPSFFGRTGLSQSQTLRAYGLSVGEFIYTDNAEAQQAESNTTLLKYMPVNDRIKNNTDIFEEYHKDRSIIDFNHSSSQHTKNNFNSQFEKLFRKLLKRTTEQYYSEVNNKVAFLNDVITKMDRNREGDFAEFLKKTTEQYSEVNNKVTFLKDIIEKMKHQEEEILSKDILIEQINNVRKEIEQDNDALYGKISKELDSIVNKSFASIEEIQRQYQKIISIFNGEITEVDREGTVNAFRPLIKELIDTELVERGRFVELLSQSIDKLSKETDEQIQKTFKQIVTTIVGEGTKQNQNMARQNTEIGLRKMSEADIDNLLGRKLTNIVDKHSNFGGTLNTLADNLNKVKIFSTTNSQQQVAQKFFDGLSFSIYYYRFTIDNVIRITNEISLPKNIGAGEFDYIGQFEKIIIEFEKAIANLSNKNSEKYKYYKKVQTIQITDTSIMQTLDVYCYFRYYDGKKIYLFLNQEPSIFFKKELDHILFLKSDIKTITKNIKSLVKSYSIPKVQVAVFNKYDFDLPSEDNDNSVISTRTGDKGVTLEEESELSNILDIIEEYYADKKIKKSIFSYSRNYQNREYIDNNGLWYFWSIKTPIEKYLSIKMLKAFDNTETEKEFITHVTNNVWHGLKSSKNTGEMQDWIDSFTRKDSNILSTDSWFVELLKFTTKNWLSLAIIFYLLAPISFLLWSNQQIVQNKLLPSITNKIEILEKQVQEKDSYIELLKAENTKLLRNQLESNIQKPFIFNQKNIEITSLQEIDLVRLKTIQGLNLINHNIDSVKLKLIPHTHEQELNKKRVSNLKNYLIQNLAIDKNWILVENNEKQFINTPENGVSIKIILPADLQGNK